MTTKQAMFVFIVGFIMTLGAVGGIEVSVTNEDMMSSMPTSPAAARVGHRS